MRSALAFVLPLALGSGIEVAAAAESSNRIPIEVEVQPGAVSCAPGDDRFDGGFRAGLRSEFLALADSTRGNPAIANPFCLASERPKEKPIHIRVRIRCDAGAVYDYLGPAPDAIRTADHWLIHIAVPLGGHRLAPAPWQRVSAWARSDRQGYCEDIGHAIALCVLEVASHETGHLKRDEFLALGPDFNRDVKYSEDGEGWWSSFRHDVAQASPMALAWGLLLASAFLGVRLIQSRRHHGTREQEATPSRSL